MSITPSLPSEHGSNPAESGRAQRLSRRATSVPALLHTASRLPEFDAPQRQAELFYLQKQIQTQTPMVIVLEDGEQIHGCIEWYDRNTLKVRGKTKTLIYKSAIKYMYKLGDIGQ